MMRSIPGALLCLGVLLSVPLYADDRGDSDEASSVEKLKATRRDLWMEGMSPPEGKQSSEGLARTVRNAVIPKIEPQVKEPRNIAVPASQPSSRPTTQPTTQPARGQVSEPRAMSDPGPPPKSGEISSEELGRLRVLSAKGVANPVPLADSLYLGGYLDEAYPLYRQGLGGELTDPDRAWVLFQMANCKRISDPPAANSLYKRVVSEYPDSRWSGIIQIQSEIIEWKNRTRPEQALEKAKFMTQALRAKNQAQEKFSDPEGLHSGTEGEPDSESPLDAASKVDRPTTRPTGSGDV